MRTNPFFSITLGLAMALVLAAILAAAKPAAAQSGTTTGTTTTPIPSAITGFTPTSGPPGTIVTISGTSLSGITGVLFNGTAATILSSNSTAPIYAIVPSGATSGPITVDVAATTDVSATVVVSTTVFTVTAPSVAPALTGFSPSSGTVDSSVTISGAGLAGATAVLFDGTPATITSDTSNKIIASVPVGASSGPIVVEVGAGILLATSSNFTVVAGVPAITSFSPESGAIGSTVTITGSNLAGLAEVEFNGIPATIVSDADSSVTVLVPAGATTGPLVVGASNGVYAASASSFTVTATTTGVHTFSAGLAMISVPTDYTGQSLSSVLGYASPLLAVWDPLTEVYAVTPTAPADSLAVGQGYWVRFPANESIQSLGAAAASPFAESLTAGWNMIGCPATTPISFTAISVVDELNQSQTFAEAVSNGLVNGTLYTFQPGDTDYESIPTATGSLVPYEGYWIYAYGDCSLDF